MPNPLEISDPFPSYRAPIIPVDEEPETDPDTGMVKRIQKEDVDRSQELARQKVRASSQQMEKVIEKITPSSPSKIPNKNE